MPSIYLETSIFSYLASPPSCDLIVSAHQKMTHDWWSHHRRKFDLVASSLVVEEIGEGNVKKALQRLELIKGVRLLAITQEVLNLATLFIKKGPLPEKAKDDAFHIATATVHSIDYLLSWNCKHIANPFIQKDLVKIIQSQGWEAPILCTPENMLELTK